MSATPTQKPRKPAVKQPSWLQRISEHLVRLDQIKSNIGQLADQFSFEGIAIGYLLNEKLATMTEGTDEQKREKLVEFVAVTGRPKGAGPRTTLQGKPYSWSAIAAWMTAAGIEKRIAEKRPDLAGKLNSDSLAVVARVEKRKDLDTATQFLADRIEKGETSVRKVRAAFDADYPKAPASEKSVSERATAVEKQLKGTEVGAKRQLKKLNLAPSAIMTVLQFAALVGMTAKDAEVSAAVLRDMLKEQAAS